MLNPRGGLIALLRVARGGEGVGNALCDTSRGDVALPCAVLAGGLGFALLPLLILR